MCCALCFLPIHPVLGIPKKEENKKKNISLFVRLEHFILFGGKCHFYLLFSSEERVTSIFVSVLPLFPHIDFYCLVNPISFLLAQLPFPFLFPSFSPNWLLNHWSKNPISKQYEKFDGARKVTHLGEKIGVKTDRPFRSKSKLREPKTGFYSSLRFTFLEIGFNTSNSLFFRNRQMSASIFLLHSFLLSFHILYRPTSSFRNSFPKW